MEIYRWMTSVWGAYKPRGGEWIQFNNGHLVIAATGFALMVWAVFALSSWLGAMDGARKAKKKGRYE